MECAEGTQHTCPQDEATPVAPRASEQPADAAAEQQTPAESEQKPAQ